MKYSAACIAALAGLNDAAPLAQFGFSIPSFPLPTGGFGFSLPSLPGLPVPTNIPSLGGGLPSLGGSLPTLGSGLPTNVQATTTAVAQPSQTGSGGGGTIGADCTPQGSGGGSTENGVADKNCCTDVTVIFARGTGELGNVGTISGPPMFKSLRTKLGADRVTVQGVDYPADAAGNANLGASGGPAMASSVKAALAQCPSTKVIVAGYSQGGMVVHNAFSAQGLTSSQVSGAVLFGDPLIRQSVGDLAKDKVKEFCGSSDAVCGSPTGDVNGGHLSYGSVADAAADFVISAAGLS